MLGAAAALLLLALLYRSPERGAIVASALVIAFFAFGHVASVLGSGASDAAQLAAWLVLIVVAAVYAARARSVARVTRGLNLVAVVLVVLASITIVPYELQRAGRAPVSVAGPVTAASGATRALATSTTWCSTATARRTRSSAASGSPATTSMTGWRHAASRSRPTAGAPTGRPTSR